MVCFVDCWVWVGVVSCDFGFCSCFALRLFYVCYSCRGFCGFVFGVLIVGWWGCTTYCVLRGGSCLCLVSRAAIFGVFTFVVCGCVGLWCVFCLCVVCDLLFRQDCWDRLILDTNGRFDFCCCYYFGWVGSIFERGYDGVLVVVVGGFLWSRLI